MMQAEVILAKIAKDYGFGRLEIFGASRRREVVDCRVLMWCVLRYMGWSTKQTERYFGRNHSTIAKLTKEASDVIKQKACDYLRKYDVEPLSWLTATRKGEKVVFGVMRPKPPELPKPKVFKKVPDYQNYCIRLVEVE